MCLLLNVDDDGALNMGRVGGKARCWQIGVCLGATGVLARTRLGQVLKWTNWERVSPSWLWMDTCCRKSRNGPHYNNYSSYGSMEQRTIHSESK